VLIINNQQNGKGGNVPKDGVLLQELPVGPKSSRRGRDLPHKEGTPPAPFQARIPRIPSPAIYAGLHQRTAKPEHPILPSPLLQKICQLPRYLLANADTCKMWYLNELAQGHSYIEKVHKKYALQQDE
jgi:hypothetical protein